MRQAKDCREKTLHELCNLISELDTPVACEISDQLVQTLRRLESPDDLFDTLISLEGLLLVTTEQQAPCFDSSSVLGLFIRKVLIKFHSGLFEGLSALFEQVQAYIGSFENSDAMEDSYVQAELSIFIPNHAAIIETAPPSLQARIRLWHRALKISHVDRRWMSGSSKFYSLWAIRLVLHICDTSMLSNSWM